MTVAKLMQNGELRVKGIDTRLPLVTDGLVAHYPFDGTTHSTNTHFVAKAQNYPYETVDGIWDEYENTWLFNSERSWHISVWDMYTNDWAVGINFQGASKITGPHARYDIYAVPAQITSFVNTINTLNSSNGRYMVAITGGHAAENNFKDSTVMKDAIKLCGGTTSKLSWTDRRTYICVGEVGCGEGNAQEEELGSTGDVTLRVPFFFYAKASTDTNTTITNEYVSIEEATTNIIHGFPNPNRGYNITRTVSNIPNPFDDTAEVQQWEVATSSLAYNGWAFNVTAGLRYTGSIIMFDPYNVYSDSTMLHDSATDFTSKTSSIVDLGNGWKKVIKSGTAVTTKLVSHGFIFYINAIAGNKLWVSQPQIEQKAFATEYVNGSRSGDGTLILPTNIGTDDFTVTGTFIPNANSDTLPNSSYILNLGGGFKLSTYNGQPFIDGNTIAGSGNNNNVHIDFNSMTGDEITYIIKRSGTTFTWRMMDSRQNITWTKVHSNVALRSVGNITFSGTWGGIHKNLSIYNRALSDSEVTKLAKGTHSFTQDGLITKSINTTGEIRYIRDYLNGSTANIGNHWIEIKANTQDGTNVALGKVPTSNTVLTNKSYITDGVISSAYSEGSGAGLSYVQIDLGAMYLIDNIQVWHYYIDGRTYYSTRTQVSHDGVKWYDVFNSANDGTYQETINGKTHYVGGSGSSAMSAKVSGLTMNGINSTATL